MIVNARGHILDDIATSIGDHQQGRGEDEMRVLGQGWNGQRL